MNAHRTLVENRRVVEMALLLAASCALAAAVASPSAVPLLVSLVLAALAALVAIRVGLPVFSPLAVVVGTLALTYGVRPLLLLWVPDTVSFVDRLDPSTFTKTMMVAAVFVLTLVAGYCWNGGSALADRIAVPDERPWTWQRTNRATVLLAVVGAAFYVLMLRSAGFSFTDAILQPPVFRARSTSGGLFYISGVALWCLWAVFYLHAVQISKTRASWPRAAWLVALFVVLAVLTWPYGARAFLLAPVLGWLWIRESVRPERPIRLIALLPLGIAMLLFVGAYGVFREVSMTDAPPGQIVQQIASEGAKGLLVRVSGRFDSFDFMAWIIGRFETGAPDYLLGRSVLDFALQPIPRSILPGKPSQTSTYLMETFIYNYDRSYTPEFGFVTECYINFWWAGVLIGGFAFGVLTRTLEVYLRRARFSPAVLFAYAPMVTLPIGWLLAGFNSFASIMFVLNMFLASLVIRYVTRVE